MHINISSPYFSLRRLYTVQWDFLQSEVIRSTLKVSDSVKPTQLDTNKGVCTDREMCVFCYKTFSVDLLITTSCWLSAKTNSHHITRTVYTT